MLTYDVFRNNKQLTYVIYNIVNCDFVIVAKQQVLILQ